MSATIAGTEYFPTLTAAYQFYAGWEYSKAEVDKKIKRKEIIVNKKPFAPAGKQVVIRDSHYVLIDK